MVGIYTGHRATSVTDITVSKRGVRKAIKTISYNTITSVSVSFLRYVVVHSRRTSSIHELLVRFAFIVIQF